ncbi:MAG: M6 family metalloprotease domain-containing protein [Prevotella sp.]|nr:M6 family metalloprotease domain-containing protein [Prevotella sp.]
MNKRITLLSVGLMFMAATAFAQQTKLPKVVNRYGQTVDIPTLDSPEANNILPRRCITSATLSAKAATTRAISTTAKYVPHKGKITIPVILVNFSDCKFSVNEPKKAFEQFFNGITQTDLGNGNDQNIGSVGQYFSEMSDSAFTPVFTILGPVTLPHGVKYYGASTDNGKGEKSYALANDAIAALQASADAITNTALYSSDGKTIDCVYLVYAGLGENYGGADTTVWAKTYSYSGKLKDKNMRWMSIASELSPFKTTDGKPMISGIGVTVHELTHTLGLPDFYPLNEAAYLDNQEMEYWDLMDGGEYQGYGYCPAPYTAFERNEMGWPVSIEQLTETQDVTISQATAGGGTAYQIVNPNNSKEYFMLELIHNSGWNTKAYGAGLLAYHVNRPSDNTDSWTRYNNLAGYPGMAVIPADSVCHSSYLATSNQEYSNELKGDLFPGTSGTTELSDKAPRPNFCWYNTDFSWTDATKNKKLTTNRALTGIAYDNATGVLTFRYINDVAAGIRQLRLDSEASKAIYTLDGRYVGSSLQSLPHGIYIVGGRKVVK